MNERIKELARQSGAYNKDDDGEETKIAVLIGKEVEKFAALIVRECANFIDDWEMYQTFTSHQVHGFIPPIDGSKKLKEHFGVE